MDEEKKEEDTEKAGSEIEKTLNYYDYHYYDMRGSSSLFIERLLPVVGWRSIMRNLSVRVSMIR